MSNPSNYCAGIVGSGGGVSSLAGSSFTATYDSSSKVYSLSYSSAGFTDSPVVLVTSIDEDGDFNSYGPTVQNMTDGGCQVFFKSTAGNKKAASFSVLIFSSLDD